MPGRSAALRWGDRALWATDTQSARNMLPAKAAGTARLRLHVAPHEADQLITVKQCMCLRLRKNLGWALRCAGRAPAPEGVKPPPWRGHGAIRPLVDTRVFLHLFLLSQSPTGALAEEASRVAPRTLSLWLALTSQRLPSPGLLVVTVQAAVHDFFPFRHQKRSGTLTQRNKDNTEEMARS